MKLIVKRIHEIDKSIHYCETENGETIKVDFFANGTMPKKYTHENIVGKTIKLEYIHPFEYLAMNVQKVLNTQVS